MSSAESRFAAARDGEKWAQDELHEIISRFARHACGRNQSTLAADLHWEDVAQEASRKVFSVGLEQYGGKGSEESYLYSVVKSTLVQMARSASRRKRREEISVPSDRVATMEWQDRIDVTWILKKLDEGCKTLLARVFLEEVPYSTLAEELALAESSVRAKVSRCLRRAREFATE